MTDFHCSFCGASHRQAKKLISGPRVFICNECVGLCVDILAGNCEGAEANAKLKLLGERASEMAQLRAELESARKVSGNAERALKILNRAAVDAFALVGMGRVIECMWCNGSLASEEAAREHVAICERHPAVIKLRESEARR